MAKAKKSKMIIPLKIERKGPYLAAALIAEKVMTEQDNVTTIVRVVDRVSISPEMIGQLKESKDKRIKLNLTIVLYFKTGGFKGKSALLLVQGGPSGDSEPIAKSEINFDGTPSRGFNLFAQVVLTWEKNGHYWFDAYLDSKFISRIPLEVTTDSIPVKKQQ